MAVIRALPRVAGVLIGLLLLRQDGAAFVVVGAFVLALSVLTNPARWWRYVRTGDRDGAPRSSPDDARVP